MTPPAEEFALEGPTRGFGAASLRSEVTSPLFRRITVLADLFAVAVVSAILALLGGTLQLAYPIVAIAILVPQMLTPRRRMNLNIGAVGDVGTIARRVTTGYAIGAVFATVTHQGDLAGLLLFAAAAAPAMFLARSAGYGLQRRAVRAGARSRTLIVGTGDAAHNVVRALQRDLDHGLNVIGAVSEGAGKEDMVGTPIVGGIKDLSELLHARQVDTLLIALTGAAGADIASAVREALSTGREVWMVPQLFDAAGHGNDTQHIGSIPLIELHPPAPQRAGWAAKRTIDMIAAVVGIVLAAPLMAVVAAAIKLDSRGPIFFTQERVGMGGRTFAMLKFRTMRPPDDGPARARWRPEESRITRVGMMLRITAIDEIPQLFNVLRGDLTLIGPRPERPSFARMFGEMYPHYDARHRVPGGITGWAQVHGLRGDTPIDERARFDNYYIQNWSLLNDLKILLLTPRTFLKKYRGVICGETSEESVVGLTGIREMKNAENRRKRMEGVKERRKLARLVLVTVAATLLAMMVIGGSMASAQVDPYATTSPSVEPTLIENPAEPESEPDDVAGVVQESRPSSLPFTGAELSLFILIGGAAVGMGALLVRRSRKSPSS